MSFWKKIKKRISFREDDDWDDWDDDDDYDYGDGDESDAEQALGRDWDSLVYSREHIDIHDHKQRHDYVVGCLEQIADAARELESLNYEYNMVTAYLRDMDEIEALPLEEKAQLETVASRVAAINRERKRESSHRVQMPDDKYIQLNSLDADVEEGIRKLSETEEYHQKIKADLKQLDNERNAYRYRRSELLGTMEDCQGMGIICSVAVGICIAALLFLQFGLGMNASWGYIIATAIAAMFYIYLFLKYRETSQEYKSLIREINRLVLLQNKVKIRYVNNKNLLDYLCLKYKVESSKELSKLWTQYNMEKERRQAFRRSEIELNACETELLHILRRYHIGDPAIWLNQTEAILDHKEMVEIRHGLIIRRQSLRKRMDYNKEIVAANAQNEIKDLVESYPKYSSEIMALVDEYESRFGSGIS